MAISAASLVSSERLADHFVSYLFEEYQGSNHVRRIASWIGLIIKAVENVAGGTLRLEQKRQIMFGYKDHQFKVKYNHKVGSGFSRGGLEIVEVLAGKGAPEGETLLQVKNLAEAEDCYLTLKSRLDSFVKSH